jgi:uncharacterized protein involved in exopolysaccharide biosynthesis
MQSENSSNNNNFDNDEISLKELIFKIREWYQYLLTKWKLIIAVSAIGGAIGLTYAFFQKPIYKADLTFAMEDEKSGGGGLSGALGLASSFGIDLGGGGAGGAFSGANLMALMKSRKIVEKTLLSPVEFKGKTISLADYYITFNELRDIWAKNLNLKNISFPVTSDRNNFTLQQDSVLKNIFIEIVTNNLSVGQADKKISIINVTVNTIEEGFSKEFCETLAKVTTDYYIELKTKKSKQNVDILQKQVDNIKSKLNYSMIGSWGLEKVNAQVNSTILGQLSANLELSKVSLRKETPLIQVIDRPILPLDKEKVSKKKSLLLGGFLAGFLTVIYLGFTSLYKKMIA